MFCPRLPLWLLAALLPALIRLTLLLLFRLLLALASRRTPLRLLLLLATAAPRLLLPAARLLFPLPLVATDLAGPLLELPDLLLHEAAGLLIVTGTDLVTAAERTALPPFRVRPFAAGAED